MSGKPYPEGVTAAVRLLDEMHALQLEIDRLAPMAERLEQARQEWANRNATLKKAIEDMDLSRPGNAGFENRLAWFLREMRRQTITQLESLR